MSKTAAVVNGFTMIIILVPSMSFSVIFKEEIIFGFQIKSPIVPSPEYIKSSLLYLLPSSFSSIFPLFSLLLLYLPSPLPFPFLLLISIFHYPQRQNCLKVKRSTLTVFDHQLSLASWQLMPPTMYRFDMT